MQSPYAECGSGDVCVGFLLTMEIFIPTPHPPTHTDFKTSSYATVGAGGEKRGEGEGQREKRAIQRTLEV